MTAQSLITPGARPANPDTNTALDAIAVSPRSPILAMHLRYEAAWEEYNAIERSEMELTKDDHAAKLRHEYASKANNAETDALRLAILYQVPDTYAEAMILQYHIVNGYDLTQGAPPTKAESTEAEAVKIAIDTLFDFLACKNNDDHEALGTSFKHSAMRVFRSRRLRTGDVGA